MIFTIRKLILIALLTQSVLAKQHLDKISLQLDWLHQFQFAGYYIAKEKGFYKKNGLDVNIKEFQVGIDVLQDTLDQKNTYAVGKSSLILDKLNGANIVALAAIYQHSPMVLLTLKKSNINTPKDLFKKKVMLTPDARVAVAIQSMIESQGLQLKNVQFIPHSFKLEDLINGTTDAMGCYLSNEPFMLKEKNIEYNILDPRDYGFDFYGSILYTSKKELNSHPTRVHNFYTATMKGWKYAFEHIEETAKLIFNKYNTQNKSLESLIYEGKVLRRLAEFSQGNLGKISLNKYSEILKIYSLLGYPHDIAALKEFIVEPNQVLLSQEELAYLKQNKITYKSTPWPPFNTNMETKHGIEFDILDEITKKIPMKLTLEQSLNHHLASQSLEKQEHIFKLATAEVIKPNNNIVFSKPFTSYDIAIATLNNTGYISSPLILNEQKVAITKNCTFINRIKSDYPNIKYIIVDTLDEALEKLSNNEISAVIESLPILTYKISNSKFTNIKISGSTKYKHDLKFVVNRDNPLLLSILNKTIDKISLDTLDEINSKYIAVNYTKSVDYSWMYKVGIPLLVIILIVIFTNRRLSKEIKKRLQIENTLHNIANTDELTGIYNRRRLVQILQESVAISNRYKRPLSVVFFDIDDFKLINDNYGHDIGDKILKEIAYLVKENIRTTDSFGRWGGEEFMIILPETNEKDAEITARHIRDIIYNYDFENIKTYISSSFGVSQLKEKDTIDTLIKKADDAMYYIKTNGKNNVKVG